MRTGINKLIITCKKEKHYSLVKDILDISGIEYQQGNPGEPLILYGLDKKKDVKKALQRFGVSKFDINYDKDDQEREQEDREI